MEDVRWHHYFSRNIRKFQSGGVGFLGLFVTVEATARVVWPSLVAVISPGFDLAVFGLCFALYWRFDRRLDRLPDRGWSVSQDRGAARLEVGRRRHAGWLVIFTVISSACVIVLFAQDRGVGMIFMVAATWLGLHWARMREVWAYFSVAFSGFAVAGPFYLVVPQDAVVGEGVMNMLLLAEFGVTLAVFAFANHKQFVQHAPMRDE